MTQKAFFKNCRYLIRRNEIEPYQERNFDSNMALLNLLGITCEKLTLSMFGFP